MRISTRDNKNSLRTDKPVEFFEPELFSGGYILTELLIFLSLNDFECIFLGNFEDLLACLLSPELFLIIFLFALVIHSRISVSIVVDIDLNWQ